MTTVLSDFSGRLLEGFDCLEKVAGGNYAFAFQ
jgi:hypothetical protein